MHNVHYKTNQQNMWRQSMTRHLQAAVDRQLATDDLVFMIVTHPQPGPGLRLPHQHISSISFPHIGKHTFTFFAVFTLIYFVHFSFQGHCFLHRRGFTLTDQ